MSGRRAFWIALPIVTALGLWLAFPGLTRFVEGAALSVRRLWWLILAAGLIAWAVWVLGKRNPP